MTITEAVQEPTQIANGRYVGSNTRYWLELRVDLADPGVISGDLQYAGPAPLTTSSGTALPAFFASFSTAAECRDGAWPIEWIGPDGTAPGQLTLAQSSTVSNALDITVDFSEAWAGQAAGTVIEVTVAFVGPELRVLGLEIDTEQGVTFPTEARLPHPVDNYKGVVTVTGCLRQAGFAVSHVDQKTTIEKEGGWTESDIFSELYGLVGKTSQVARDAPAFEIQVLALSHTDRDRLLGLSFDNDSLPRQGVAVFLKTIERLSPTDRMNRKIIATTVHEIGHALNLVHRSDYVVGRSASPSFMDYDYRYRAGPGSKISNSADPWSHADGYWDAFRYTFDPDELRHLRHAGRTQIVPGGASFGSASYWQSPSDPGAKSPNGPRKDLRLWLTPPKAGTTFAYGQPVFLTVSLMNMSRTTTIPVARHALDVKAEQLQLLVRPCQTAQRFDLARTLAESTTFVPIMRRCFDVESTWSVEPSEPASGEAWRMYPSIMGLGPGESMHANANLAYSSASVPVDPGDYELTPILSLPGPDWGDGRKQFVVGVPIRIHVSKPKENTAEEADGHTLHRPDVRASLALGGSPCLQDAAGALEDLRERRQRDNRSGAPDPIAAILTRAEGIDQGRQGNTGEAARLLYQATTAEVAQGAFDPHTREHTRRLADRYCASEKSSKPISVVVDVWTRPRGGGESSDVVRSPGFLVVQEPDSSPTETMDGTPEKGTAWGVLAPASTFPDLDQKQNDIFAEVVVAPGDGLTQRISVNRIDIVNDQDGRPSLAALALTNPFPADRRVPAADPRIRLKKPTRDVSTFFDQLARPMGSGSPPDQLSGLAYAADESLRDAALSVPDNINAAIHYPSIEDIASLCDWVPWCEPVPPPTDPLEPRAEGSGPVRPPKRKGAPHTSSAPGLSGAVKTNYTSSPEPSLDSLK